MRLLWNLIFMSLAVFAGAHLIPGIYVEDYLTSIVVAMVIALLNIFVKPVLILLTIPVTMITLGLFLLVINAIVVIIAEKLVAGFEVDGFWWALLFSLFLSLTQWLFSRSQPVRRNQ
jgi:putative membrane protein